MGCEGCPVPGSCCRFISIVTQDHGIVGEINERSVAEMAEKKGWPFKLIGVAKSGWAFFSCPKLIDGKCSDYKNRPDICRDTPVGEGHICAKSSQFVSEDERAAWVNRELA